MDFKDGFAFTLFLVIGIVLPGYFLLGFLSRSGGFEGLFWVPSLNGWVVSFPSWSPLD